MVQNFFSTANTEGIDVLQTYTITSQTPEYPGPPFELGQNVAGNDGSAWIFLKASTTISAYAAVGIDTSFNGNPLSSTMAASGFAIAWPQVAVNGGDYFWAAMQARGGGAFSILVASSAAAGVALYTTTTPGVLDDSATATQVLIEGVVIVTTQASTTGLAGALAIATYPRAQE
jgi:hypothetical protein